MRYILNSAVISTPGTYTYTILKEEEVVQWIKRSPFESRVGYPQTAEHIYRISGIFPPLSRETMQMESGDEALVIRLKYRIQDPSKKGETVEEDWEYGLLKKL